MCGIGGIAGPANDELLRRPIDRTFLRHRGPDGFGEHVWRSDDGSFSCRLVHSRLAIRDLTDAGLQPCFSEDRRVVVSFNGEIYNYHELRSLCEAKGHVFRSNMDGEVIPHLWEEFGPAGLAKLNGIFAVALLDTLTGELVLARDPLGVKPISFVTINNRIVFASEPRALEVLGADLGGQDLLAAAQFLTFLWIPNTSSPFSNVQNVLPGEMIRWNIRTGQSTTSRYTQSFVEVARQSTYSDPSEVGQRLTAAVERQMVSDVPVGLMASGGVDSSSIWHATGGTLAAAYTIDWRGVTEGGIDEETSTVAALGKRYSNTVVYVPASTRPPRPVSGELVADPAYELTRTIAEHARRDGVKVLLSGQGGDEVFGGYRRHTIAKVLEWVHTGSAGRGLEGLAARLPGSLRAEFLLRTLKASRHRDPFARYMTLCSYSSAEQRAQALGCSVSEVSDERVWSGHRSVWDQTAGLSNLRRALLLDLLVYLPGLGVMYADRAGMEQGVEIRVPFLDLELVRWSFGLPDGDLVSRTTTKVALRKQAKIWLGEEVSARAKQGFGLPASFLATTSAGPEATRQESYFASAQRALDLDPLR